MLIASAAQPRPDHDLKDACGVNQTGAFVSSSHQLTTEITAAIFSLGPSTMVLCTPYVLSTSYFGEIYKS